MTDWAGIGHAAAAPREGKTRAAGGLSDQHHHDRCEVVWFEREGTHGCRETGPQYGPKGERLNRRLRPVVQLHELIAAGAGGADDRGWSW